MSSSQPSLGGPSRAGRILGPALDKIVKNASWRKNSALVSDCKYSLDLLQTLDDVDEGEGFLLSIPNSAVSVLSPIALALDPTSSPKILEPALHCLSRLALSSPPLLHGKIDASSDPNSILFRLLDSLCSCTSGSSDDSVELLALKVLIAFVRCGPLLIRGDCLVLVVRSCYNVYLSSASPANQVAARVALAQIVTILFARVDADSVSVPIRRVSVADMLDLSDKNLNDAGLLHAAQAFLDDAMEGSDRGDAVAASETESTGSGELSMIREDGIYLFKNLCKFSMKFAGGQENAEEDPMLLKGKLLSLELLKMVVENAGPIWRTDERFLGAIKQYLCLSLLKNSALSMMSIFQLLCSIFMCLLSRFRSGLKGEIGIFFPMLLLRVLENVLQPSFLQKMTVLNLLEKICQDPQIIVDLFVNYDCDVEAPNIYERIVNGLLKTALGVPSGSATTLSPAQDITFRSESVKCLTTIIKSMGVWMDQQLHIDDFSPRTSEIDHSRESHSALNGEEGPGVDYEDSNSELSNAATLEQRRAYKLELQKGISLFNRKPSKGIEFLISTKKVGGSPEEVASFLKNTTGLNETMIGDYLGERDEFPLKVMHAYVDALNFEGINFGESIRFFLRGFKLPGEAQKIDRIMEKFAERYCKCNPSSFTSADTAYVLAYSVIMLNTDAHNNMVKEKMSKADFIRNNRGIDDGKDLPEDYLGSLYDHIVKNEIKMNAISLVPQNKQASSILDNIFNLMNWKQAEEKALGASEMLIKHIQEQFKAKSGKSESIYYTVTDTAILRFMMEVCWAPMMAAFSVTLDQSDDKDATSQCLLGYRYAVHVTSVMRMQTQRDAFVTSVAKFTYLHCAADMKQKNVDAVKTIISIAIEDGNHLQDSWEHVLTCLSRFEHLHLLGEGAPTDASFFTVSPAESEEKSHKSNAISTFKRKGNALQIPAVMAVVRGGSYDSASIGINASGLVTPEQINNFISNLNLLDQIGTSELNHIFAHSQRLNGDAIVAFVKALCKVSMAELQSPTDPRVFSLTKIVEIAHYNMNRIRLVWSRIWNVLSDFFVSVGLSENLSVAIFVMDSLRQLAMKFLEREELANYNFQNDFLRPFAIVMQKSNSSEIRELIVRCVSQMVLSRVNNVKSGWKSVFMVFTIAADDERKNIVLLAFETMEKIVRDYFPYITETETTTFTDCVKCLITFTNSRFNSDASLNAIAFLRFCAVKLAEGGVVCYDKDSEHSVNGDASEENASTNKDDHVYFWVPLLSGLSKLTSDSRQTISKGSLEVLFDILKDHGHLFSRSFWNDIFKSVIYPIFSKERNIQDQRSQSDNSEQLEEDSWNSESDAVAAQCLVDLLEKFFDVIRVQLVNVVEILTGFIRSPHQQSANIGITALLRLTGNLGSRLSETEWREVLLPLKDAVVSTHPLVSKVVRIMHNIEIPDRSQAYSNAEQSFDHEFVDEEEDANMETASYAIVRLKGHIALQLLVIQAVMKLHELHQESFSAAHISILLDILSSIASHANEMSSETTLHKKLQRACSLLEISDTPVVYFENESYQNYLKFLQTLLNHNQSLSETLNIEYQLVTVCVKILQIYLHCAAGQPKQQLSSNRSTVHWTLPLGSTKKDELAARTSLIVSAMEVLSSLEINTFRRNLPCFFPLLVNLIRCEHSSGEVQRVLYDIFHSSIGPILLSV